MMKTGIIIGALALTTVPAAAQEMDHSQHDMSAMTGIDHAAEKPAPGQEMDHSQHDMPAMTGMDHAADKPAPAQEMDHSQHDMPAMTGMDHAADKPAPAQEMDHSQHDMSGMTGMDHSAHRSGAADGEVGNEPAPPVPTDNAARRFYPADRMDRSLAEFSREGSVTFSAVFVDQLEYRAVKGGDGYAWDAQAWYGGDIDRAVVTTEGEGAFGSAPEQAEVSALWRHAFDPYFNLEAGVRHDFKAGPQRTYAVLGVEGLAPYWFELESQLLVSNKGDVHARLEASYDLRITQFLILQPDVEVNFAFQDLPELGIGSGFESIETGLRLRYQFTQEFAPYVGVNWERSLGETARLTRAAGDRVSAVSAVAGVRLWF